MVTHFKFYKDALLILANSVYDSKSIPQSTKIKLLKLYQEADRILNDDLIFFQRVEENKDLIVRNGNKITITIPNAKNKKNASAYIFAEGVKKRYDALKKAK